MTRGRWSLGLLLAGLVAVLGANSVLAHGTGAAIEVEPDTVTGGGTVTVVGENLEPNDERILVLTGAGLTLDLGTVTTDHEGMFSTEVVIPSHLPGAVYELQAIGDETLTAQLNVVAAAGVDGQAPPESNEPDPRERSPIELVLILAAAAGALGVGVFLTLQAERLAVKPRSHS